MLSRRSFGRLMGAARCCAGDGAGWADGTGCQRVAEAGPQFSVMMWALNKRGSFEENLERVAQAGYGHVELVGEFARWSAEDWRRILARMQALKITVDATSGVKAGFADPAGGDAFVAELKGFIPTVQRLGCGQIILLSGKRIEGAAAGVQQAASIEALKRAAEILSAAGLTGVIEPIDRLENPTIYLDGVTEAFEIVRAVGSPKVKVLYDLYHEQRGMGNLIEKLEKNIDEVGLIHVADVPGRHEPGTGEINYRNVYRKLAELHYRGVIAMEFYPTGDVVETLRRAREEALRAWGTLTSLASFDGLWVQSDAEYCAAYVLRWLALRWSAEARRAGDDRHTRDAAGQSGRAATAALPCRIWPGGHGREAASAVDRRAGRGFDRTLPSSLVFEPGHA